MAAAVQASNFAAVDFVSSYNLSLTIGGDANYLHVIVLSAGAPSSVNWNTSETMTLDNTQTTATSYEARHYKLSTPTKTSANVSFTGLADATLMVAVAVSGADTGSPIRGYNYASYSSGHTGPKSLSPSGVLTDDLMLLLANEYSGGITTLSGSGGSAHLTNSPIESSYGAGWDSAALYEVAGSDGDSIAVTWAGEVSSYILMFAVAIAGGSGGGSPAGAARQYYSQL